MDLILASTSPYRRALLERLGLPFRCLAPGVDEEAVKALGLTPARLAERLAEAKADAVARLDAAAGAAVIGSDQLVSFEGRVLGKPGTPDRAVEQLLMMSGRPHELITAMAVRLGDRTLRHTDVARLHLRPLTRAEVERYVLADRPLDCAGSYKLESRGIALFDRIECADHTAIVGLPLIALTSLLRDLGFAIP
ncbi:Maf family protein [Tautonia plasticadhaerens]|uniref:7-methyl-GTP pyrophosphatase n=1 Tax=Tautonia plasticadhaerens TaxID=2527974 RepID=A0A518GYB5_9BACT|nr:nucleoside triphosphate pyrophosphatase [Tautonia plasticadhaerens]QDV33577.1 Maf-like protein YceF [Tautonia plasticadhaerens]